MIRRSILSHPRAALLLMLVAVAAPIPAARSQDRAIQDRLDRLERDLSMLQRQVYRSGPPPVITAGPGAAVDAELRMDRLETQMRELTGRIEDTVNGVEQLRRRLEQINSDIDVRFSQGQGQPRNPASSSHAAPGITDPGPTGPMAMRGSGPGATPTPSVTPAPARPPSSVMPPGTLVPPPRDPPTGSGTLTPPGPPQAAPEPTNAVTAGSFRPPSGAALPAGSASEQYNYAFGLLKQADYSAAEGALKTFIAQHPDDPLAGSAQYWLGETYYTRGRYAEAASAFAEGYKRYPKGAKAADDLLKLGMSLARDNRKHDSCLAFVQLDHDFPNPGNAIKERSAAEKKRLGC
jgi:tol-pal system protein YbgF